MKHSKTPGNKKKEPFSAVIFDIQRFSLHDGPGIRTNIYFKGCPLSCLWCSNPESQKTYPEFYFFEDRCEKGCLSCVQACPNEALEKTGSRVFFYHSKCDNCERCMDACKNSAIKRIGSEYVLDDVMDIALRDIKIYIKSGGGITFTGGEATTQAAFLDDLNRRLKKHNIHTCIETCGFFDLDKITGIIEKIDLVLFDLKIIDDDESVKLTGKGSIKIIENLKRLSLELKKDMSIRIPLVPGITNTYKNITAISDLVRGLDKKTIKSIDILPYHTLGISKYGFLGREYTFKGISTPTEKEIEEVRKCFKGYETKVIE